MKHTGRYCRHEDEFDLEQEINTAVDETKEYLLKVKELDCKPEQLRAILRAIATTIVDAID